MRQSLRALGLAGLLCASPAYAQGPVCARRETCESSDERVRLGVGLDYRRITRVSSDTREGFDRINAGLERAIPDFEPVGPSQNIFAFRLHAGYYLIHRERWGIGPVLSFAAFGGPTLELYKRSYELTPPGSDTPVADMEIAFGTHIRLYMNVSAGIEVYYRPHDRVQFNIGILGGIAHLRTQSRLYTNINASDAILAVIREMGERPQTTVLTDASSTAPSLTVYGGLEVRVRGPHSLFVNAGYTVEHATAHLQVNHEEEGRIVREESRTITQNNSGPTIELGWGIYF